MKFTFADFISAIMDHWIVIADWNREEVDRTKAKNGSADALFASLVHGYSMTSMLAYWHEKTPSELIDYSTENPIYLTDGGHRFRWMKSILRNEVTYNDENLSEIQESNPSLYETILGRTVIVEVASHHSIAMLEVFAKAEYEAVNSNGEPLCAGERLRASDNQLYNDALNVIETQMPYRMKAMEKRARDGLRATVASITNGALGRFGLMTTMTPKTKPVIDFECEPDESAIAMEIITALTRVDSVAYDTFKSNKDAKKILEKVIDIRLVGPFVAGLVRSVEDTGSTTFAENLIAKFYNMSLSNSAVNWKKNVDIVMRPMGNNGGHRMGAKDGKYHIDGWTALKALVMPRAEGRGRPAVL